MSSEESIGAALRREVVRQSEGRDVHLTGPLVIRDNSRVYRARCVGSEVQDCAVKLCLLPGCAAPDLAEARAQFTALQRVNAALSGRGISDAVPTPFWLNDELGAYSMRWVEGESLTKRIAHASSAGALAQDFFAVGRWLGRFHQCGPLRKAPVDLGNKVSFLEDLHERPVNHGRYAAGLSWVTRAAPAASQMQASISWLHGDCKADNFLLAGEGVCGIDISLRFENSIEHDLAQFLNHAELLLSEWRHRHLWGARAELVDAFQRGYAESGPAIQPALLQWQRLWAALAAWYTRLVEQRQPWYQAWRTQQLYAALTGRIMGAEVPALANQWA